MLISGDALCSPRKREKKAQINNAFFTSAELLEWLKGKTLLGGERFCLYTHTLLSELHTVGPINTDHVSPTRLTQAKKPVCRTDATMSVCVCVCSEDSAYTGLLSMIHTPKHHTYNNPPLKTAELCHYVELRHLSGKVVDFF